MKKQEGFTIIEVVIALFVLTVAVAGVYGAFSVMVVTTSQMSERFTAAYLAQEGIEIIRNIRDNNWINPADPNNPDWTAGLLCGKPSCDWEADYTTATNAPNATPLAQWSGEGRYLLIDSGNFYSYHAGGQSTNFTRKITVEPMNYSGQTPTVLKVSVTVYWEEKQTIFNFAGNRSSIIAEDYLYNWY